MPQDGVSLRFRAGEASAYAGVSCGIVAYAGFAYRL